MTPDKAFYIKSNEDGTFKKNEMNSDFIDWKTKFYNILEIDETTADKSDIIQFNDKVFSKSDLSQETIEWLENYNKLSKAEQLSISSIPADLYNLYNFNVGEEPATDSNDTIWMNGITFTDLEPGAEIKKPDKINITNETNKFTYSINFSRTGLILEVGLVTTDGTEYVEEVVGGAGNGYFENLPLGEYYLIARNSGDYSNDANYKNGSVYYKATGVLNYKIE